jgi:hypothetical protein
MAPRWDAALEFDRALYRWQNWIAYGSSASPLDDPEPRFSEFIECPSGNSFAARLDRRVDVCNDVEDALFDDKNFDDRHSTWQLLLAAEQADAGIRLRMNLAGDEVFRGADAALQEGRIPEGVGYSFNFTPVHAARDFEKHENTLDAVVWFSLLVRLSFSPPIHRGKSGLNSYRKRVMRLR